MAGEPGRVGKYLGRRGDDRKPAHVRTAWGL
jgi:hypothetical protein